MARRVCNKVRYSTPEAARKSALRQNQVQGDFYFCVKCDAYHLTHIRWKHKRRRMRHG